MFSVGSLLLALLMTLLIGGGATWYFSNVRRRQDEAAAGVRALSAMRWREFSHFVLDAMRHRGYDVLTRNDESERGQQTEFLLARNGQRWLLSCKHGSAYRISAPAVAELAASIKFQGARGGILVTPGRIEPDARPPASAAAIELVDGARLWPELAPLLPPSLVEDVRHEAGELVRRQVSLSWLAAVVGGLALGLLLGGLLPDPAPATDPPPPLPMAKTPAAPTARLSPPVPADVAPMPDEADEEAQRSEIARRVARIPGVAHVLWSTRSTLLVEVDETSSERFGEICAVLVRYEFLRTTRIQLQPPAGSEQRVRFRQCRTL